MLEILERQVEELELLANDIEKDAETLFKNVPFIPRNHSSSTGGHWEIPSAELKKLQEKLIKSYEKWYSSSSYLVAEYMPERAKKFVEIYEMSDGIAHKLQLLITGWVGYENKNKYTDSWEKLFSIQRGILLSIPSVARIKEKSLRKILTADIASSEIEEAELLFKNKRYRAAGAVAGVALERYLKTLCEISDILYEKHGIASLAHLLHKERPTEMDNTVLSQMIYLGRIRDDCVHPNEISEDELKDNVRRLIDQIKPRVMF